MFGLPRLYVYAAAFVAASLALWGVIEWIQAAERHKIENDALKGRIETLQDTQERRDEIETLPDDALLQRLIERLRDASN